MFTRLRIGHTAYTHEHLLKKGKPPICNCGVAATVNHILDECTIFQKQRQLHYLNDLPSATLNNPTSHNISKMYNFLKACNLYIQI